MPKATQQRVVWSAADDAYYLQGSGTRRAVDSQSWAEWLAASTSFAFEGRQGYLNLLRETRGNDGYWYAYRRQGQRTFKKYAGSTARLSLARLEELAALLSRPTDPTRPQPAEATRFGEQNPPKLTVAHEKSPLLLPKLSLPRLHSDLIERERLLLQLDQALQHRLTIISAPAGFGKTTLARQWLSLRQADKQLSLAWLSLDQADNEPGRFWRYFMIACQTLDPAIGRIALEMLETQSQPPFELHSWEKVLVPLLNDLAALPTRLIMVLEDFHALTHPHLYQTFEFLVDHLPNNVHLLLLTRTMPGLPLTRWRVLNELGELSGADLRFRLDETQVFLEKINGLSISPRMLAQLDEKLEGWAAALRLVALAWRNRRDGFSEDFNLVASQPLIVEYFVNEILNAQPPVLQDFLLRTCLLKRLTPPLCQAVTGYQDSQELLDTIGRANLFLEMWAETGQWYRYHALFRETLQREARRRLGPVEIEAMLRRASDWYSAHQMLPQAIEAALAAGDFDRAITLMEQFNAAPSGGKLKSEDYLTLRQWAEALPVELLDQHPNLRLNYALALLFIATTAKPSPMITNLILHSLAVAEAGFQAEGNQDKLGEVAAFRSLMARQEGQTALAVSYANQALQWLSPQEIVWRSWSLGVLGTEAYLGGELKTAREKLLQARAIGQVEGNRVYLRANAGMLAGVHSASGELHEAAAYVRAVLAEAREENDPDDIAHAQLGLSHLSYEWNDLDTAWSQAQEAFDLAHHYGKDEVEVGAVRTLAQIEQARGQTEQALTRLAAMLSRLQPQRSPLLLRLYSQVRLAQARCYLAQGNLELVQAWQDSRSTDPNLPLVDLEIEELLVARLLLVKGQPQAAHARLEANLEVAQAAGRYFNALKMQLLLALTHAELGRSVESQDLLKKGLTFAVSQGYRRLFLDEGQPMQRALRQLLPTLGRGEKDLRLYVQRLLTAFEQAEHPALNNARPALLSPTFEPLSRQEEKVLRLLSTGHTNPQIARELIVSVNTVRSQVQSIYRKLNVNDRQTASQLARQYHLI